MRPPPSSWLRTLAVALASVAIASAWSACRAAPIPGEPAREFVAVAPGIRVAHSARVVEIDGLVPIDARAPGGVALETVVCTPDTREHETLLVSNARPSDLHAALLRLGLNPGSPGGFDFVDGRLRAIDPTGPRLRLTLLWNDAEGRLQQADPADWIIAAPTHGPSRRRPRAAWVFAGSGFNRTAAGTTYHADLDGTTIGLAAFGTETIAYADAFSPESAYADQAWFADPDAVPPPGTSVTVRIQPEKRP